MTELQIFIMELTLSMIEIQFVIRYYFYVYGVPRLNIKKICVISAALMFIVTSILRAVLAPIRPVSLPVITVLASLLLLPLFRTRWEKKVLFSFILIGVSSAWVLLSDLLVTPLPDKNIGIIYIVFHGIFWCILEAIKNIGKEEPQQLSRGIWLLLTLIAASSCTVIVMLQINAMQRANPYLLTIEVPILTAFLLIDFALLIFFDHFSKLVQQIQEQSLLQQQIALQNEHYKQLESYHEQISSLHHDMKNHINAAVSLTQIDHESEELLDYLQSVNGVLIQAEKTIVTGNPKLDAVLNLKLSQLRYASIQYETQIHIPSDLPLSFEDSIVIFGNLLDNAREACENLAVDKRWVHITISYNNGALYIKIDNSMTNSKIKNNSGVLPSTTKINGEFHGFGLKNVKRIVEKRGTLHIDHDKPEIFSVRIILYEL